MPIRLAAKPPSRGEEKTQHGIETRLTPTLHATRPAVAARRKPSTGLKRRAVEQWIPAGRRGEEKTQHGIETLAWNWHLIRLYRRGEEKTQHGIETVSISLYVVPPP